VRHPKLVSKTVGFWVAIDLFGLCGEFLQRMVGGGNNIDGCWLCRSRLTSGCVGRSDFQPAFGSGCVSLMVLCHVLGPALGVVSLHLFGLGLPLWPLACRCCIPPLLACGCVGFSTFVGVPVSVTRLSFPSYRCRVQPVVCGCVGGSAFGPFGSAFGPSLAWGCVTLHFLLAG
jgi:hypothetical protein